MSTWSRADSYQRSQIRELLFPARRRSYYNDELDSGPSAESYYLAVIHITSDLMHFIPDIIAFDVWKEILALTFLTPMTVFRRVGPCLNMRCFKSMELPPEHLLNSAQTIRSYNLFLYHFHMDWKKVLFEFYTPSQIRVIQFIFGTYLDYENSSPSF